VAGVGVLNAHIAIEWVTSKKIVIPCMVFPTKLLMCLNLKIQDRKFQMNNTKIF